MLERALVAGLLLVTVLIVITALRVALRQRDARIVRRFNGANEGATPAAGPRIVYFTTRTCVVCRVQQEPAIEALLAEAPELMVERHDAIEDGALASEYGVLSVPTTAVYDRSGELVAINRGFASAAVLHAQLDGREVQLESGHAMSGERVEPGSSR